LKDERKSDCSILDFSKTAFVSGWEAHLSIFGTISDLNGFQNFHSRSYYTVINIYNWAYPKPQNRLPESWIWNCQSSQR